MPFLTVFPFLTDTFEFHLNSPSKIDIHKSFPPILNSDSRKFKNPPLEPGQNLSQKLVNFTKPKTWPKGLGELYPKDPNLNGVRFPPFINWMAVAPFRAFYKPLFVLSSSDGGAVLPKGTHRIIVDYSNLILI